MSSLGRSLALVRRRFQLVGASVAVAAALAAAMLVTAGPANASLTPGTGWTQAVLPANYYIYSGELVPVSCAAGTQFCLAIVSNGANRADVVTTNGGQDWTGYNDIPPALNYIDSLSCVSTSVCWALGENSNGGADVAETIDGGQTWTDQTPAAWGIEFLGQGIDCVSADNCWVVGWDQHPTSQEGNTPWVADTTDGGATWTTFTNLPAITEYDPNGTYQLDSISCLSALDCIAAGGLNEGDGVAQVISTTDGGDTWSISTDPVLQGVQEIFGLACFPVTGGLPVCNAVGSALGASGPVEISSADGGATWSGSETYDTEGWFASMACPDARDCWLGGWETTSALLGTDNGGASWSQESAAAKGETNVACATLSFCIATPEYGLWYTTDDGGIGTAPQSRPLRDQTAARSAGKSLVRALPQVSGANVWVRAGRPYTAVGKFRGLGAANHATAQVDFPGGGVKKTTVRFGLNDYYQLNLGKIKAGTTKVTFTAQFAKPFVVRVHSRTAPAPTIKTLSAHAGPARGGSTVTVTGTNFSHVSKVLFGAKAGTHLKVTSATRLTVRAPAGIGTGYVSVVTTKGGPSPLTGHAAYNWLRQPVITELSPTSGPAKGGTVVTITGSHLSFVKAVDFGPTPGTDLIVVSPTEIKITSPAGHGIVNVSVTTAGGTTVQLNADRFTY